MVLIFWLPPKPIKFATEIRPKNIYDFGLLKPLRVCFTGIGFVVHILIHSVKWLINFVVVNYFNKFSCHIKMEITWPPFGDVIFEFIFLNDDWCVLISISPKFVTKGPIDHKSSSVQIMAWRGTGIIWTNDGLINWRIYASLSLRCRCACICWSVNIGRRLVIT